MKYLTVEIPEDCAYIIPIADIHWGDKNFKKDGLPKLKGYLDWCRERKNARIFLNGDIFNVSSRSSKTSPHESDISEYDEVVEFLRPYKDLIIGAVDGNHEERMMDDYGFTPTSYLCGILNIPYCRYSAVVRVKVGKRRDKGAGNRYHQNYFMYFHHTTGGGGTVGGKLNRVAKLRDIVEGIDVYCGSHNHQLAVAPIDVFYPSIQENGVKKRRIWYVDCGSYAAWEDSYAEKGMLAPVKLGSPRIRLDGKDGHHDVHVSL